MKNFLEWPDVAICMDPLFKDKKSFEEFHSKIQREIFANLIEFQSEVDQVFFKAEDIVQGVLIGDNYLDAVKPNSTKFEINVRFMLFGQF